MPLHWVTVRTGNWHSHPAIPYFHHPLSIAMVNTCLRTAIIGLLLLNQRPLPAQWAHTQGPPGMTTTTFLAKGNQIFVGTEMKGVYRSDDHGATWSPANSGIENEWVMSLADDATYMYAGTLGSGVYRSSDQGLTWTPANNGIQTVAVKCLLRAAGFLWAGAIGGMWRSPDQGQTWEDASGGALGSSFVHTMVYRAPRLEVEADNYLFWSEDLGESWNVDQGSTAFYVIDHFLQQGDTVLASANNHVFRTTNGLMNWGPVVNVDPDETIKIAGLARQGDTLYAGYKYGVFRSTDWGMSWTLVPSTGLRTGTRETNHFTIDQGGVFLLAFEEIGVYRSLDQGLTWTGSLEGLGAHSGIDDAITISGDGLITGTHSDGVFRSQNDGDTWSRIGTPDPFDPLSNAVVFSTLEPQPGLLLAGTCGYGDGLYRSDDNGATWAHITDGLPVQSGTGFTCINALAKAGTNIIAATTAGVYYSTDLGLSWNATTLNGDGVYAGGLAANGAVACVGIASGAPTGIYRSTNSGATWQLVSNIPDVISIASDGVDHFYAGSFTENYRSTNNGSQWNPVGPGIPESTGGYCALALGADVFIGNSGGVWHSADHGASFATASDGLDPGMNRSVQGLAASDQFLFAGLHRNGIWRRPLSDFDITTSIANTATEVTTLRAWPNPAMADITVAFTLRNAERVTLTLHDASGRMVRTWSDERMSAGEQKRSFAVDDIDAGRYVLQLATTNSVAVSSITIVR
jgi:hypothetical protein